MNNWMKVHQILAALFAIALIMQNFLFFFLINPKKDELEEIRSSIENQRQRLKGANLPLDAKKLDDYLSRLKKDLEGKSENALFARSKEALAKAGDNFAERIKSEHGSVEFFMKNASRIDYQAEYDRVLKALFAKGLLVAPEVLKLSEDPQTPYIYQPLMQIWTVEKLTVLALESGLAVCNAGGHRRLGKDGRAPADIEVCSMKAYFAQEKENNPYLLEFPVGISLEGDFNSCMKFISSLGKDGVFLPVRSFEIFALPPRELVADSNGLVPPGMVQMKLVCSSYLVPVF